MFCSSANLTVARDLPSFRFSAVWPEFHFFHFPFLRFAFLHPVASFAAMFASSFPFMSLWEVIVMGWEAACLGAGRYEHMHGKGNDRRKRWITQTKITETRWGNENRDKMTAWWRRVWVFVCQLWSALIGSLPPLSRLSFSGNYTLFFPFCFVRLRFSLLVLVRLCYWRQRAHTTTPFQYPVERD